jgi:hypothetical protein
MIAVFERLDPVANSPHMSDESPFDREGVTFQLGLGPYEDRKYTLDLVYVLKGQVRELGNVHALHLSERYHMRPENFESME